MLKCMTCNPVFCPIKQKAHPEYVGDKECDVDPKEMVAMLENEVQRAARALDQVRLLVRTLKQR